MSTPPPSTFLWHRRVLIPPSTTLVKFTEHDLYPGPTSQNPAGFLSPWWAFLHPGPNGDPGLDALLASARRSGRPLAAFLRDAFAVHPSWNAMSLTQSGLLRLQRIRLTQAVDAFHGPAAPQPGKSPPLANPPQNQVDYPGGAFQLYIPSLSSQHAVGAGFYLL